MNVYGTLAARKTALPRRARRSNFLFAGVVGLLACVAAILMGAAHTAFAEAEPKVMSDEKIQEAGLQLLKNLPASYRATFKYRNGKQTKLNLTIKYDKGRIEYVPAFRAPPGMGRPDTLARIRVPVVLHFSTEDGAFDETLKSVLETSMEHLNSAEFQANPGKRQGKFSPDPDPDGYQLTSIGINGTLTDKGTRGSVGGGWSKPGRASMGGPIGYWEDAAEKPADR